MNFPLADVKKKKKKKKKEKKKKKKKKKMKKNERGSFDFRSDGMRIVHRQ